MSIQGNLSFFRASWFVPLPFVFVIAIASRTPAQTAGSASTADSCVEHPMKHPGEQDLCPQNVSGLPDQQPLPMILEKTGALVDEFLRRNMDLVGDEQITETKLGEHGEVIETSQIKGTYYALSRGAELWGTSDNLRTDAQGNEMAEYGLKQDYLISWNFALSQIYFSTELQAESQFVYLGDTQIGSRTVYVVAFAQKPEHATITTVWNGGAGPPEHAPVESLMQGVAWVDKTNFQILRMSLDLLTTRPDQNPKALSSMLTFTEVQLPETSSSVWLPGELVVYIEAGGQKYRNEHRFTGYKRYQASLKMAAERTFAPKPGVSGPVGEPEGSIDRNYYATAHPYLEEDMETLAKRIPELRKVKRAADQRDLPRILAGTGGTADALSHDIVDLVSQERIRQRQMNARGSVIASEQVQDNYLILRQRQGEGARIVEYRMDTNGKSMDSVGLKKGYVFTFGFALESEYFGTDLQPESTFRYLGDQKLGTLDTYVVAFAQKPDRATLFVSMFGQSGRPAHVLVQGVAWIDKNSFQIVRIRTDLLAPEPYIGLDQQTTEVEYNKVRLQDLDTPLWLPEHVKVFLGFEQFRGGPNPQYRRSYQNEHHYTDYRQYRVSVKMVTPK